MTSLFQNLQQASHYAKSRPTYPKALFDRIVAATFPDGVSSSLHPTSAAASVCIDVGCGSGQATQMLSNYFDTVIGIDPSPSQIEKAKQQLMTCSSDGYEGDDDKDNKLGLPNIYYRVGSSQEPLLLPSTATSNNNSNNEMPMMIDVDYGKVDCVTVAQAVHWFDDMQGFYNEVHRTLRPNGILAIWCYGNMRFPKADADDDLEERLVQGFYRETLHGYWDERRTLVENGYRDLELPNDTSLFELERVENDPSLDIVYTNWTSDQLIGYLRSWSGYTTYCEQNGIEQGSSKDPLQVIADWLEERNGTNLSDDDAATPSRGTSISISWPVSLLLFRAIK